MKSTPILQIDDRKDNPLRKKARLVEESEFGSQELKDIVEKMSVALAKEHDGVAIAAPQIGVSLRIFVVAETAYEEDAKFRPLVFINPKITRRSKKTAIMQEGCLSVRWIYGKTKRSVGATIEAYDITGTKFTFGAGGLLAHIFQHEVDHLDGVLFIDHGFDLEEFSEEEVRNSFSKK